MTVTAEKSSEKFHAEVTQRRARDICIFAKEWDKLAILEIEGSEPSTASFRYSGIDSTVQSVRQGDPSLPFPSGCFDVVFVNGSISSTHLGEIHRVLRDGGEMILGITNRFLNTNVKMLKKTGFVPVQVFSVVPKLKNPLYWIDLLDSRPLRFLMKNLPGQGRKMPVLRRLAFVLCRVISFLRLDRPGILRWLGSDFVMVAKKKGTTHGEGGLAKVARRILSLLPHEQLAFLVHSGLESITILVFHKTSKPVAVLKMARDSTDTSLGRQHHILSHLAAQGSPNFLGTIPRTLGWHPVNGVPAFAASFLEGRRVRLGTKTPMGKVEKYVSDIRNWLAELSRIPVPEGIAISNRFGEAKIRIRRLARKFAVGSTSPVLKALEQMEDCNNQKLALYVPVIVTHRDLGFENILWNQGELRVIDWGNSHYGFPLTDWMRFIGYFLSELEGGRDFSVLCRALFSGKHRLSKVFYRETKQLCQESRVPLEWVVPLVLLGLFDFLEGFHYYQPDDWEERFAFVFADDGWVDKLNVSLFS